MSSYENINTKQLYSALVDSFNLQSLDEMLMLNLEMRLENIVAPNNLQHTVLKLIQYFRQRSRIGDLVTAAYAERPDDRQLRALIAQHDPAKLLSPTDADDESTEDHNGTQGQSIKVKGDGNIVGDNNTFIFTNRS